jgi:[NiFe] hydrogenase diaphorase moiety large subunit
MLRWQLLNELWKIQDAQSYINDDDIRMLAEAHDTSMVDIDGVVTFYHFFHRKPTGKFTIYLNDNIIAEMKGRPDVLKAFERATGARMNGNDPLGTFSLFETSCIGLNDQEPSALINFRPFTNLTPDKVEDIIKKLRSGVPIDDIADKVVDKVVYFPPNDKAVFKRPFFPGQTLEKLLSMTPEAVIQQLTDAGLTGRGGANFPTGLKWSLARKNPGEKKYIVCNADEGEPGTFKDRFLLNEFPGLVIEGMIAAGYAVGATTGIIYLRAEYRYMKEKLEKIINNYRKEGWLKNEKQSKFKDFEMEIRIQLGAGAYVCGEETALLESMEGKRGEPRLKVFFPVEKGYRDRPTVVNNVETFAKSTRILELGADFYKNIGTEKSKGTRLLSISGDVKKPGIYEIEWGMTLGEMLDLCGAKNPYFVQVSGPAGTLISAEKRHRRIATEDLNCNGSVMVFDKSRDILTVVSNFSRFFKKESCGVCTPCRAGNFIISRKLEKFQKDLGIADDVKSIFDWANIMQKACRCGLGRTAPNSVIDSIVEFPQYYKSKLASGVSKLEKGFDLEKAVAPYEKITGYDW